MSDESATKPTPAAPAAAPDGEDLFCPFCGYNLRGTPTATRCAECGMPLNPESLRRSTIPWESRKTIGRFRAFWKTAWLVTRRPSRLAWNINAPLSYGDAQKFRWVVTALLWVSVTAVLAVVYGGSRSSYDEPLLGAVWDFVVLAMATAPFAVFVTGLHNYWFENRRFTPTQRTRILALATYSCGVLAWLFVLAVIDAIIFGLAYLSTLVYGNEATPTTEPIIMAFAISQMVLGVLACLVPMWFYGVILQLLRATMHGAASRRWNAALLLPVAWLLVALMTLVLIPAVAFGLSVFAASLR